MAAPIKDILDGAPALFAEHPGLARTKTVVRAVLEDATSVEITAGAHHLRADEPEAAGGHDSGPSPIQLALGALASCTAVTYRYWSELLDTPISSLAVEVRGEGDLRGFLGLADDLDPAPTVGMTVHVRGPATSEQYYRLHREVEAHCPVLRLLDQPNPVKSTLHATTEPTTKAGPDS